MQPFCYEHPGNCLCPICLHTTNIADIPLYFLDELASDELLHLFPSPTRESEEDEGDDYPDEYYTDDYWNNLYIDDMCSCDTVPWLFAQEDEEIGYDYPPDDEDNEFWHGFALEEVGVGIFRDSM